MNTIPFDPLRKTIFVRLLFMFFIVILPIILLGIYLYNWSYNNASEEISKNTVVQLSSYLDRLHREFEWMEIQQYDILQEGEMSKIAFTWDMMSNSERKSSVNYMLQRLASVKNTNVYIKDILIHIPSIHKSISAVNGVQGFNEEGYKDVLSTMNYTEERLIKKKDSLSLNAYMVSKESEAEPHFVIQFELDEEQMGESLNAINLYPDSSILLISPQKGVILAEGKEVKKVSSHYTHMLQQLDYQKNMIEIEDADYHINKVYSNDLELSVVTYIPKEMVRRPLSTFSTWAWVFTIASIFAVVLYSFSTYRIVHRPLFLLVQGFQRMEKGDLETPIQHSKVDEFGYLYERYNQMLFKLRNLIEQDYKQKLMMQEAELKQLQSQINPHFLYNSFFILNSLAKTEDFERIEMFTNMLGEYFRFITRNGETSVTLREEIKHARMYSEIQMLRFSRRIRVEFQELPREMEDIKVPKLIVQPIVENAYEHSLEKMVDEGLLSVRFEMSKEAVFIIIEDNGDNISDDDILELSKRIVETEDHQEFIGLKNIQKRIVLTYGQESGLILSRSELNGLKVMIKISLKEEGPVV